MCACITDHKIRNNSRMYSSPEAVSAETQFFSDKVSYKGFITLTQTHTLTHEGRVCDGSHVWQTLWPSFSPSTSHTVSRVQERGSSQARSLSLSQLRRRESSKTSHFIHQTVRCRKPSTHARACEWAGHVTLSLYPNCRESSAECGIDECGILGICGR